MGARAPGGNRLAYLKRRFEELGIRPRRQLGQNFLLDRNAVEAICRDARVGPLDTVLEVGPGSGLMTTFLGGICGGLVAVEFDTRLAALVREQTAARDNVEIVEGDILERKFALNREALARIDALRERFADGELLSISNLPYSIAVPFMANLAADPRPWARGTFLVQLEEAERAVARPGTDAYGAFSVTVALATREARIARTLPPQVFWPRPRVQSAVLLLQFRPAEERAAIPWKALRRVSAAVFAARRKTLRNAVRGLFAKGERDRADRLIAAADLDPGARPEALDAGAILALTHAAIEAGAARNAHEEH
jgi:16S rRNA (adenine1518-N6/adenine1519-N6)-dimethyltransferase